MPSTAEIRSQVEKKVAGVVANPATACGTATTHVSLKPGLECTISDGPWTVTAGMSPVWGGNNAGPNPGVLGRGAFGACLAIGYAVWAARLGIPIDSLDVTVEGDYDSRGELGISDVTPAYLELRYHVSVTSPASEIEILTVLDTADQHSPYLAIHRDPVEVRRTVEVHQTAGA